MAWKSKTLSFLFFILLYIAPTTVAQNNTDRAALLAIRSDIKADPQRVMTSWNDSLHFCQWQGVTCSSRRQRVVVLDLSSQGLVGSLSPYVGNLSFLRVIAVQNNSLDGRIPPQISRLFRLQELRLNNNSFEGTIPANLSRCTNLKALNLGDNKLVGKIPDELGSLSMLASFIAHQNNFEGGIPRFIGNFTSLQTLSLAECRLTGTIPDVFHSLNNLRRIALVGNNLVGTIPPSFYNLSLLKEVFLDSNRLEGALPENLGSMLPHLQVLSIPDNRFTGPFPFSLFNSSGLGVIDAARNNFTGEFEFVTTHRTACKLVIVSLSSNRFESGEFQQLIDSFSGCSKLEALDLGENLLTGLLPKSLGNLSSTLYFLSFASNGLSGDIPLSITNLSGLTSLDLSRNRFTGIIPANIGDLQSLRRLDLEENDFSGNIPASVGNLSLLIELDMSLNRFNGTIPSSLGNCKRLLGLKLDSNNLTGDMPRELFDLTLLSITLNLGKNHLTGKLPQEVGNLRNLNELIIAENRLSGELPSSLGSCSSLQTLDMSGNSFQGSLPASLSSLRALQNLDISSNNFTGQIPSYLETIPLENINMSFNSFEGEVGRKGVFANASAVSVVGNARLCGGVPELRLSKCGSKGGNGLSLTAIVLISSGSVSICLAVVCFFVCYRRKREEADDDESVSVAEESLLKVSYEMLYKSTEGFSLKNMIGKGSFSSVYRGYLDTSGGSVAIKVLNLQRRGGSKSFVSECEALRNTRHRNLVKVISCCSGVDFQGNEFKAIIYDFMPNGSLDRWLDSTPNKLSLVQRVCVALDVAYALDYLHRQNGKTIVHCDLKPSNVLLDQVMVAHVGDFGLSKIFQYDYQNRYNSSSAGVKGTVGYAAPEYGVGSKVSTSGDMYSYGILVLEMVTGKKPTDPVFEHGLTLHGYASGEGESVFALEDIVDPFLLNDKKGENTCVRLLLQIGVSCSRESPHYRMDTATVIQELNLIKDALLLGTSPPF